MMLTCVLGGSGVMVNTRRMESSGSGPYSGHRYCTRVCVLM